MEHLEEDLLKLVSEFIKVAGRIGGEFGSSACSTRWNTITEFHRWFKAEEIAMMYRNNPVWASVEREAYDSLPSAALEADADRGDSASRSSVPNSAALRRENDDRDRPVVEPQAFERRHATSRYDGICFANGEDEAGSAAVRRYAHWGSTDHEIDCRKRLDERIWTCCGTAVDPRTARARQLLAAAARVTLRIEATIELNEEPNRADLVDQGFRHPRGRMWK